MARRSNPYRGSTGKGCEFHAAQAAAIDPWRRVVLVRVPDPVVITGREGSKVRGRLDIRRTVDYLGWCTATGVVVGLECKETSTGGKRWTLDARLRTHQLEHLRSIATAGGVAAIYVRRLAALDNPQGADYLVPVSSDGIPHHGTSPASITWADLERWRIGPRHAWPDAIITPGSGGVWWWRAYTREGWASMPTA